MSKLFKKSLISLVLTGLAIGPLIGGPMARAGDDTRSERSDLDLSRHDRGELWDDDGHEILKDRHHDHESDREQGVKREHERERDGHREMGQERENQRERDVDRDRDTLREQSREHNTDHEGLKEREKQND